MGVKNNLFEGCAFELMEQIEPKSIQTIIIDPPYFEIKGDFDFKLNFEQWQELHERLAVGCKRILKDNGSIFLYGHARNIAYQQAVFDKYFNLLNNLVWYKKDCQNNRYSPPMQRRFVGLTERILFYDNDIDHLCEKIFYAPEYYAPIKSYMREQRALIVEARGFTKKAQFDEYVNEITQTRSVASRHYFADSQWEFPTAQMYARLQTSGFFKREYEELRRPFLNQVLETEILTFSQETHTTKKYKHPTQKPLKLTRHMLSLTTRPGDSVFIPFAGSGVEIEACIALGMDYYASEINPEYCELIRERIKKGSDLFSIDVIP